MILTNPPFQIFHELIINLIYNLRQRIQFAKGDEHLTGEHINKRKPWMLKRFYFSMVREN